MFNTREELVNIVTQEVVSNFHVTGEPCVTAARDLVAFVTESVLEKFWDSLDEKIAKQNEKNIVDVVEFEVVGIFDLLRA